jgi:hypothetical protein
MHATDVSRERVAVQLARRCSRLRLAIALALLLLAPPAMAAGPDELTIGIV